MSDGAVHPPAFVHDAPEPGASAAASDVVRVSPRLDARLPRLVEGQNGGTIYRGGLPKASRPESPKRYKRKGRDKQAFTMKMRALADSRAVTQALQAILCDPEHDHFMRAVEFVTERGYGRVPQRVETEGTVTHAVVLLPALETPASAPQPVAIVPAPLTLAPGEGQTQPYEAPAPSPIGVQPSQADPTAPVGAAGRIQPTQEAEGQ